MTRFIPRRRRGTRSLLLLAIMTGSLLLIGSASGTLTGSAFDAGAGNGNASENIELNQGTNGKCAGSSLFQRVTGDRLLTIDYTGGGTNADFNVLTWIDGTDATNSTCFVGKDVPPCWGAVVVALDA